MSTVLLYQSHKCGYNSYMAELVPFQEKRNKKFPEETSAINAVESEFHSYFAKYFSTHNLNALTFAQNFAPLTSPTLLADDTIRWTAERVTEPLLILVETQKQFEQNNIAFPKRRYLFLPKPYQKMLKKTLTSKNVLEKLAESLHSAKKAKRIMRIAHRRYGIYTQKKPKFEKID